MSIFREELENLKQLEPLWNEHKSPSPELGAFASASTFLDMLDANKFPPSGISVSANGGLIVYFLRDKARAHIEFFDASFYTYTRAHKGGSSTHYGMTLHDDKPCLENCLLVWRCSVKSKQLEEGLEEAIVDMQDYFQHF